MCCKSYIKLFIVLYFYNFLNICICLSTILLILIKLVFNYVFYGITGKKARIKLIKIIYEIFLH